MWIPNKQLIYVIIGTVIIAFLIGWLFPVEGPLDYVYDDYVKNKKAVKNVAKPIHKKEIFVITDEEVEEYLLVPKDLEYLIPNEVD